MTGFIGTDAAPAGGEAFEIDAADGTRLRAAVFPAPDARAGVVLMGGRCEFIEKYFEVIEDLRARGFSVAAMDWRGQGLSARALSDPRKGHVSDFALFRDDLRLFTEKVARKRLPGPLVLATHSMGGTPALQLLADGYDAYRAAVLCAPLTRLYGGAGTRLAARLASRGATALGAGAARVVGVKEHSLAFEGNSLTSDPARHERFRRLQETAPQAIVREPTFGWLAAAIAAMDDLHRPGRFDALKTPTLIVSAEKDELVDTGDHATIAAASPLIDNVVIADALHEIMMERDDIRERYWRAFDSFVEPRLNAG